RAALVARQGIEHLFAVHDLFQRERLVEERERVVRRVLARLLADLAERLALGAVLPAVLTSGAAEHLRRRNGGREALHLAHEVRVPLDRRGAIRELRSERALLHLLEAEREDALVDAALD